MKKCFEAMPSMDDLKSRVIVLKEDDNKKTVIIVLAIVAAILAIVSLGVVYLVKTRMDDEYDEDWDYDWDDLDDEDCACGDDDCCCTDKDVDASVKVEQI